MVLTIAIVVFLVWVAYVVSNSRRRTRRTEKPAPNQEFFMDNVGLENDRLTRVLTAAVIAAGVLAIVMPIYFVNESNRQKAPPRRSTWRTSTSGRSGGPSSLAPPVMAPTAAVVAHSSRSPGPVSMPPGLFPR